MLLTNASAVGSSCGRTAMSSFKNPNSGWGAIRAYAADQEADDGADDFLGGSDLGVPGVGGDVGLVAPSEA
jgi:hypothetical protein